MSTTIDERVVEMQFDNNDFSSNVNSTINLLDKLKSSLNLTGAAKGLENVDQAAQNIDMSQLGNAVDSVRVQFSALQVVAVTALTRIANKAVSTAENMLKALTITPITTGFQEYETQINAVQTILANTEHQGTTLQDVNSALDELNTYADKTIYNFTQMTKNIGTFTAAGVDLETSVASIKGIANLAAVSGSTSQQASTAMYQLSQALAAGRVSLMDWNSVVNAGMGGKVFQNALARTSEMLGTGAEAAIKEYGSFRESLTQGAWLTTEVLTETLKQFAGAYDEADLIAQGFTEEQAKEIAQMAVTAEDAATKVKTFTQLWDTLKESAQSGWTQTWEILIGDFGEAKEVLTEISDVVGGVIQQFSDARNTVLSGGLSTGWKQLLNEGIDDEAGYIEAVEEVAKKSGDAFSKIVDEEDEFTDALVKGLKNGTVTAETLETAAHNLAEKMGKMTDEEKEAAGYTTDMIKKMQSLSKSLKDGTISMEDFTEKIMKPSGRENIIESLWNAAKGLVSVLKPVGEAFKEVFPAITADNIYNMTENLRKFTEKLSIGEKTASKLKDTFKGFFSIFDILRQGLGAALKLASPLLSTATDIIDVILDIASAIGRVITRFDEFIKNSRTLKAVAEGVHTALDKVAETFSFLKEKTIEKLSELFDKLSDAMDKTGEAADAVDKKVSDSIDSIGGRLEESKFVKFLEKIYNAAVKIGETILNIIVTLGSAFVDGLTDMDLEDFSSVLETLGVAGMAKGIKTLADNLSAFFDKLGSLTSSGGIRDNLIETMESVRDCLATYQKQLKSQILLTIAKAMSMLAVAVVTIGSLEPDEIKGGIAVVTALFADLALFSHFFGKTKLVTGMFDKIKGAGKKIAASIGALVGFSTAVLILTVAVRMLAGLDPEEAAIGIATITILMAEVLGMAEVLRATGGEITKGCGQMILVAAAVAVMATAFKIAAAMSWEELGKGASVMVVALAALVGTFAVLKKINGIEKGVGSMITVAIALAAIAGVFKIIAIMSWEDLGKGAAVMVAAMATLVIGLNALKAASTTFSSSTGAFKKMKVSMTTTAGALIIAAVALGVVAAAMKLLSTMNPEEIAISFIALAGGMTMLVIALQQMPKDTTAASGLLTAAAAIIILAGAIKMLSGIDIDEAAIAVGSITVLLGVLIGAGALLSKAVGIAPALQAFSVSILTLGAAVMLLGLGLTALGLGITALSTTTATSVTAFIATLTVIVKAIINFIPTIAGAIAEGITTIFEKLADSADIIAQSIMIIIASLLDILTENIPDIVDQLMSFIIKIIDALTERAPELVDSVVNFVTTLFGSIYDSLSGLDSETAEKAAKGILVVAGIVGALALIEPIITTAMKAAGKLALLIAEIGLIFVAFGALAQIDGLKNLIEDGGDLLSAIGYAIGDFVGSIISGLGAGLTSGLPEIGQNLSDFMTNVTPFINGAKSIDKSMLDGVSSLAKAMLIITGADLLSSIMNFLSGGNALSDFTEQLVPFGKGLVKFSDACAGMDTDLVKNAAMAGTAIAELADALPKTGGILSVFAGDEDIEEFADNLEGLGEGMSKFAEEIVDVNTTKVSSVITQLQRSLNLFTEWKASFGEGMVNLASFSLDGLSTAFENSGDKMNSAVGKLISNFKAAVSDQTAEMSLAFTDSVRAVIKAIRNLESNFKNAGKYLGSGLIKGIKAKKQSVYDAGYELGQKSVKGIKDGTKEKSPSKLAIQAGEYLGEGLVIGMRRVGDNVYSAGEELGQASTKAISSSIASIANAFDDSMDSQPTIRPIVDLSEVRAGADSVNSMFSRTVSLGPTVNAGVINTAMNRQIQNGEDSEVVSAIRQLGKELGNRTGDTYTINGVTYDDGSNITDAVRTLVRAARIERRV